MILAVFSPGMRLDQVGEPVTRWCAVGPADFEQIEAGGWRALPGEAELQIFGDRAEAVRVAREKIVAEEGAGHVLRLQVRGDFAAGDAASGAPGSATPGSATPGSAASGGAASGAPGPEVARLISADDLARLNAALDAAIVEVADFRGPVAEKEFADGPELPEAWRDYLRSPSWFRRGTLASGKYVWLYPPAEARDILAIWEAEPRFPGIALIGGDGGLENFVLDLRRTPAPVLMVSNASESWDDAIVQAPDVADFLRRVEDGTFDLAWEL
jgi:hypothetical protein